MCKQSKNLLFFTARSGLLRFRASEVNVDVITIYDDTMTSITKHFTFGLPYLSELVKRRWAQKRK